jgi:hypothetical protein
MKSLNQVLCVVLLFDDSDSDDDADFALSKSKQTLARYDAWVLFDEDNPPSPSYDVYGNAPEEPKKVAVSKKESQGWLMSSYTSRLQAGKGAAVHLKSFSRLK